MQQGRLEGRKNCVGRQVAAEQPGVIRGCCWEEVVM